ncbi:hypothetical protein ERO13_A01G172900v2 [Gossypium hirsutum]|uniref:Uncharacterized protein n=1 Tax=Gossypium hirsutum TaxID=3635 RepID=A0A1U8KSX3_GOSHI|nr:uncharacterized protein LOC107919080 [Gossypium hirsutum]KAG4215348.1 hypothetical protein ERO13_A01G172900v2 [Gossypium hirsutum]
MATTGYHTRSNSFPSRAHPLTSEVDEHLSRLALSESASTSSSLNQNLGRLQDLHDCTEKLLLLPLTQQILSHEQQGKYVDELLNGSLGLLDVFTTAKDALLQVKERTVELQSILRRKRGPRKGFANDVRKYLSSKKAAKREILKALKNLKHKESPALNETCATVSVLREVQAVTLSVLESLFSFTFGVQKESHRSPWSLVSNLLHTKRVNSEGKQHINEMANAEASLLSLATSKTDLMQIEKVQNELKLSEYCLQDFEEGLEGLLRGLIKIRVNILNILNN